MSYAFDLLFAIYPDASYPYMLDPQNVEAECEHFLQAAVPTFSSLKRQVFIGHLAQHTDQIFRLDDLWVGRIGITRFGPEAMQRLGDWERAFDATQPEHGARRLPTA